ncbi:MAG: phosphodiester glycosidase family protein [Polyangiales bacterium]
MRLALAAIAGLATACRRAPPPPAQPSPAPRPTVSVARPVEVEDGSVPATWEEVAPGVRWRGALLAFDAPPPAGAITLDRGPASLRWVEFRLDLARVSLVAARVAGDDLARDARALGAIVAVDGGFFEPDRSASGVVVSEGIALAPYRPRGGSGVLTIANGLADVVASEGFGVDASAGLAAMFAVQCGPRLVERDGSVGIRRDDGRRAARTAACVRDGGRTLDLVVTWDPADPTRGPGLLHLARRLGGVDGPAGEPGCERALNLDGGPSTGAFVRGRWTHRPRGPTPWLLVARARGP